MYVQGGFDVCWLGLMGWSLSPVLSTSYYWLQGRRQPEISLNKVGSSRAIIQREKGKGLSASRLAARVTACVFISVGEAKSIASCGGVRTYDISLWCIASCSCWLDEYYAFNPQVFYITLSHCKGDPRG